MSQTISGYLSTLVTLGDGGAYASPTTIGATLQASGGNALLIANPWVVTLTGDIAGPGHYGNLVEANGFVSFDNTGVISGGAAGINLYQGGAITNAGTISGYHYAIDAYAGGQRGAATPFFNVTNSGYIGAPSGEAIFGGPGRISNTGTIFAAAFGILDVTTIVNDGLIHGRGFIGAGMSSGGTLENQSHGVIIGGLFGVYGDRGVESTVNNAGYILGGTYAGLKIGYGVVSNTGTIESGGGQAVYFAQTGSLVSSGVILSEDFGGTGVSLAQGGAVTNTGTITGFTGIVLYGGTLVNDGLIQGETHNNNAGTISPGVNATAVLFTSAGTFVEEGLGIVFGSIIGDGGMLVLEGGSLAQVSGFAEDVFVGGDATLSAGLAGLGVISGFGGQDRLVLTGQSASSGSFYGHGLTLSDGAVVDFAGSYGAHAFLVTPEAEGAEVAVACFLAGTRIATPAGEVAVERLVAGDMVRTVHAGDLPVKWVGRRSYAAPFCNHGAVLPVRIAAGALGLGVPARELWVSPGHAVWVGGALVPAGRLVNGTSIAQAPRAERLEYYHIELAAHELLLAEGCPAESLLAAGFRGLFQNEAGLEARAGFGLPRVESGFWLDSVRGRLGVAGGGGGRLCGFVDELRPGWVAGWAQDEGAPVVLDVLAGGRRVARVVANEFRADLARAGVGSGCHGFAVRLAGEVRVAAVARARDGVRLGLSRACAVAAA